MDANPQDEGHTCRAESRLVRIEEKVDGIATTLNRTDIALHGNGGHDGLILEVDRLKQTEQSRRRAFWAVATAAVTSVIASAWAGVMWLLKH